MPRRVQALVTLLVAGAAAILIAAAAQRDALQSGVPSAAATREGTEVIVLAILVCATVGLLIVAIDRLRVGSFKPPATLMLVTRTLAHRLHTAAGRGLAIAAVVCVAGIAAVAVSGWAGAQWREFKAPAGTVAVGSEDNVFSRLSAVNGNGRYQHWQAALDATGAHPWKGIGPGTYEFWWLRHPAATNYVRDAHSLYFETLAETGIVGFALLAALLVVLVGAAVARSRGAEPATRVWIAAAAGALGAFAVSAAIEWVWELGAIACAVMLLAAVICAGRADDGGAGRPVIRPARSTRAVLVVLAVASIGAIAVPLASALAIRESRAEARTSRLAAALQDSATARRLQPYAATPLLQRALILEQAGALAGAASAARAAASHEPTNWRHWFILARIQADRGEPVLSAVALREARRLNPRSTLLATGG